MTAPVIRRTYADGRTLVHVVRHGRRWLVVREHAGQYRTGSRRAPATPAGLRYVVTGDGPTVYRSMGQLLDAEMIGERTLAEIAEAARP